MLPDSPFASRTRRHLADLQRRGLGRAVRPPSGTDLSSNDYLGLARDPRVVAAFIAGLEQEGSGSTGSRLLRGHRDVFTEIEAQFAAFKGTERALFFSSGYLANLAVLTAFAEPDDVIYCDVRSHASLIDAARLSRAAMHMTPHNDVDALARRLERSRAESPERAVFVVVESLYSMDGDCCPLEAYAQAAALHGAALIVDEAHAVGIRGAGGSGLIEESGLDPNACVSINTAGKALGVGGAFVAGPEWAIDYLTQRARPFIFSTAAPPATAHALKASLSIIASEPERRLAVTERSRYVRQLLRAEGLDVEGSESHVIPIVVGENERAVAVAQTLQREGFDVRAIRPPTVPAGSARLRISVNAQLDIATLDRFVSALTAALRQQATTVDA